MQISACDSWFRIMYSNQFQSYTLGAIISCIVQAQLCHSTLYNMHVGEAIVL